ncbi:MAG: hypothetical protein O2822_09190, partial [Chloroflexi bacterium]|nr:hypothetical protein [Chloroflexota bacterium]
QALVRAAGRVRDALDTLPSTTDARALPDAPSPDDLLLAVTGGVGVKACVIPFWGGETAPVTRRIDQP